MRKYFYLLTAILTITVGCNSLKRTQQGQSPNKTNPETLQFWYAKDPVTDGIPGISLEKLYQKKKVPKTANTIIVAVLDTPIDLNHEDLQGQLWVNTKEIPDNQLDDDHNGYTDDVNGWNFTGKKQGGSVGWGNLEYVRLVRKWEPYFKDRDTTQLSQQDRYHFKEYQRANASLNYYRKFYQNWGKSLQFSIDIFPSCKDSLRKIFPDENYTLKDLDSVYALYKTNDKTYWQRRDDKDRDRGAMIDYMRDFVESGEKNVAEIIRKKAEIDSILQKNTNLAYNERDLIGDNPNILEKGYGNNQVSAGQNQKHGTEVAGIIAANRSNNSGIKGFSNQIRIMPLALLISGDEYDKDIAMAIYYAVDHGAKIINMSFGKEFSLEQQWVTEAIQYAQQKNVLIVHVAGNTRMDIDKNPYFPSDYSYQTHTEVASNFITVGASTHTPDVALVHATSGYGQNNVDLFAPGAQIFTTVPGNQYQSDSGTSLAAPMVSGAAALIWLHYPGLTVQQVKQILLDSGTAYDLEVWIPGGENQKVPFRNLSKSGKILNVYRAMEMAKTISEKK
ncbi:S8 family serine peptidase [Flavobacterium sp.]|uniref:S8 family serine peptidase n=1 Tax=Flavobacterium sp. TaxID=239 RepID=UPI0039E62839